MGRGSGSEQGRRSNRLLWSQNAEAGKEKTDQADGHGRANREGDHSDNGVAVLADRA